MLNGIANKMIIKQQIHENRKKKCIRKSKCDEEREREQLQRALNVRLLQTVNTECAKLERDITRQIIHKYTTKITQNYSPYSTKAISVRAHWHV